LKSIAETGGLSPIMDKAFYKPDFHSLGLMQVRETNVRRTGRYGNRPSLPDGAPSQGRNTFPKAHPER